MIGLGERRPAGDERAPKLASDVFAKLRHAIATGELRPNERLIEADLADRLKVSRTPVREALHRLAADGLVVSRGRSWTVYEQSPDEVRWMYECRASLESEAARLAVERAPAEELDEIAGLSQPEAGADPVKELLRLNDPFHEAIIEASGNPVLRELIHRSRVHYFNSRLALSYTVENALAFHAEHLAMAEALRARDRQAVVDLARRHVEHSLDLVLSRLVI